MSTNKTADLESRFHDELSDELSHLQLKARRLGIHLIQLADWGSGHLLMIPPTNDLPFRLWLVKAAANCNGDLDLLERWIDEEMDIRAKNPTT